jgi:glutamyl-Q tRNA(Asp) synthetase
MTVPTYRFAPSPNGPLHLGHALSAILNFDLADRAHGRFLLRIEDIDAARCRPAFEAAIYRDLAWLGLSWEQPARRQSEHFADYAAALARLDALGLVYPSFESRAEIARMVAERDAKAPWRRDPDGVPLYPGTAKTLSAAERRQRIESAAPYALRLDMAAALACAARNTGAPLTYVETGLAADRGDAIVTADPGAWGDVVLARRDSPASYHLCVVVDDALQGVTHVVRGRDLERATDVHCLLQRLLYLPPPVYHHHRLILDANGRKLSKSGAATGLAELRATGATPADIRRYIGLAGPCLDHR